MDKEKIIKKGNESIAAGILWGVGAVIHPCPLCIVTSSAFILNGIREKITK